MYKVIVHNSDSELRKLEDLLSVICSDNHLINYQAVISVPVLATVQRIFSLDPTTAVSLTFSFSTKGGIFTISSSDVNLRAIAKDPIPLSPTLFNELYLINTLLVDEVIIDDGGHSLQLIFHLKGIQISEASRRVQIIDSFYSKYRIEVHQDF